MGLHGAGLLQGCCCCVTSGGMVGEGTPRVCVLPPACHAEHATLYTNNAWTQLPASTAQLCCVEEINDVVHLQSIPGSFSRAFVVLAVTLQYVCASLAAKQLTY